VSITIIGAGLGGLILGSGGTYCLLNPRIDQAEAEKAALSVQLHTVTEQLRQLQRQVSDLQRQIKQPPLGRVQARPLLDGGLTDPSREVPLPVADPILPEEAAPLTRAIAAAGEPLFASPLDQRLTDDADDLNGDGTGLDLDVLSTVSDLSPLPPTPELLGNVLDCESEPPLLEPPRSLEVNSALLSLDLASSVEPKAPLDLAEGLGDPQISSPLAPAAALPPDLSSAFPPDPTPIPEEASPGLASLLPQDQFHELPEFLVTGSPLQTTALESLSPSPVQGSAPSESGLDKMPHLNPFELGPDPEATWIQSDPDAIAITAAELALELSPNKSFGEEGGDDEAGIPVVELTQETTFHPFSLGADPEATWVYPEPDR
jgi:hypothetical protein